MRIVSERDLIAAATRNCAAALPRKPTDPGQTLILLEANPERGLLAITAGGPEMQVTMSAPAASDESGQAAVPGAVFHELVRELPPGEIILELEPAGPGRRKSEFHYTGFNVACGSVNARLYAAQPDAFTRRPEPANPDFLNTITVASRDFAKAAKRALHTVAREPGETAAAGVNLAVPEPGSHLHLASTDHYRISSSLVPIAESTAAGWTVTLPAAAIRVAGRLAAAGPETMTVTVTENPNQAVIRCGDAEIISSKIAIPFPDLGQAVPKAFAYVHTISPRSLKALLAPAQAFSHTDTARVEMTHLPPDPDNPAHRLQIDMDDQDLGRISNLTELEDAQGRLGQTVIMQYRFLTDIASIDWEGNVDIRVPDDNAAVMCQNPEDSDYFLLVARMGQPAGTNDA